MKKAFTVIDLGFGDAGKGTIVDALVRKTAATLVVRFNGGPQAAHNVVTPAGAHHTFSQFGSGTLAGADTYLTGNVYVDPIAMLNEADRLRTLCPSTLRKIRVNPYCYIITPWHQAINQLRELCRGVDKHGSCGVGMGEAVADVRFFGRGLMFREVNQLDHAGLVTRLSQIREQKMEAWRALRTQYDMDSLKPLGEKGSDAFRILYDSSTAVKVAALYREVVDTVIERNADAWCDPHDTVVLEGAQGVLLDEEHGCRPHTTWSRCTSYNALKWLSGKGMHNTTIGVTRAYMVRHGTGPLPTETKRGLEYRPDAFPFTYPHSQPAYTEHNPENEWQGKMRCGFLDFVALRYAIGRDSGVDVLAVTCLDHVPNEMLYCSEYRHETILGETNRLSNITCGASMRNPETILRMVRKSDLVSLVEAELSKPVGITSHGPTYEDKEWRTCFSL